MVQKTWWIWAWLRGLAFLRNFNFYYFWNVFNWSLISLQKRIMHADVHSLTHWLTHPVTHPHAHASVYVWCLRIFSDGVGFYVRCQTVSYEFSIHIYSWNRPMIRAYSSVLRIIPVYHYSVFGKRIQIDMLSCIWWLIGNSDCVINKILVRKEAFYRLF